MAGIRCMDDAGRTRSEVHPPHGVRALVLHSPSTGPIRRKEDRLMPPRNQDETAAAPLLRPFTALRNFTIGATDGDIGTVDDVYFDDLTWTVRYLVVDTGTWLSGRKILLSPASLRGFDGPGMRVRTELTRRQVEESPSVDTQKPVSRQHETDLVAHYGYTPYWSGPYRWGPYAYPYPLLEAGVVPSMSESPGENR